MEWLKKEFKKALANEYFEACLWILGGMVACVVTAYFFGVADETTRPGRGLSPSVTFLFGFLSVLWGLLKIFLKALEIEDDDK